MSMQSYSVYIHDAPDRDATFIYILELINEKPINCLTIDKKTGYISVNKIKGEMEQQEPFLIIPGKLNRLGFIEAMLDGILQAGYKPRKESVPEETQATKAHLSDMRSIAFNFINMIDNVSFKRPKQEKEEMKKK